MTSSGRILDCSNLPTSLAASVAWKTKPLILYFEYTLPRIFLEAVKGYYM